MTIGALTRGHAGAGSPAEEVRFDVPANSAAIVVVVALDAGAWEALGPKVLDLGTSGEIVRIGEPPIFMALHAGRGADDGSGSIDEVFD